MAAPIRTLWEHEGPAGVGVGGERLPAEEQDQECKHNNRNAKILSRVHLKTPMLVFFVAQAVHALEPNGLGLSHTVIS